MYQYTYGGKSGQTFDLIEAQDLVVVRTQSPEKLDQLPLSIQSKNLVSQMIPIASFPEANVTVFKCIDKQRKNVTGLRNQIRKSLKKEETIRFAGRVLKDRKRGEPVVYTENFFIKFKNDTPAQKCQKLLKEAGLTIKEPLTFAPNAYFVKAPNDTGLAVFNIAEQLLAKKEVEYCHPELVRQKKHKSIHPNQWHLMPTIINGIAINQHIHIQEAWEKTKGAGIIIAVIDDGIDQHHEEFSTSNKITAPRDTVLDIDDANPKRKEENHGTCCAGVACADGQYGASGVAPEAKLMPIRSGGLGSIAEAKAFQWASDRGADIISCSWGPADGHWWDSEHPLHRLAAALPDSSRLAIEYAIANGRAGKGCIITWAAGNGNESVDLDGYASFPKVIAVAASNDRGKRSYYSDYGKAIWCCFPSNDVYTDYIPHPPPLTSGIWTTDRMGWPGYNDGDADGNYTASFGGTSSSCPGVAGIIALMLSVNQELTWEEVREIIKNSCDKIDAEFGNYDPNGHSPFYGYGQINATKAVENAIKAKNSEANYTIKGVAQFNKLADVSIEKGAPTANLPVKSRLLGFSLNTIPFHPDLNLHYQTIINNIGSNEWAKAGEYSGTKDKRRKLIGLRVKISGALATQYDIHYQVKFRKRKKLLEGKNGSLCGTDQNGGDAIENFTITIVKK